MTGKTSAFILKISPTDLGGLTYTGEENSSTTH